MLTGRLPFEGPPQVVLSRIRTDTPRPPSHWRPDIDPTLEAIVRKAMAPRAAERYRAAGELTAALGAWAAGNPQPPATPVPAAIEAAPPQPALVRVELPDGSPVTVSVEAGAPARKMAVSVRERAPTKKGRRRVAVTVVLTFSGLLFVSLLALWRAVQWGEALRAQREAPLAAGQAEHEARMAERNAPSEKARQAERAEARALAARADALQRKARLQEAVQAYRKAIDLDPKLATAHNNLGLALQAQGRLQEAVVAYRQAILLEPDNTEAHTNLGNALKAKGDFEGAIACYRRAIAADPKDAQAHTNLGIALHVRGNLEGAAASFRKAIALDPKNAGACARLPLIRAALAQHKRLYRAAAGLYADAFAADAKLADGRKAGHRYNAACFAALAGCGKGEDAAKLDAKEKARLRQQARAWLQADLTLRSKQLQSGKAADRAEIRATMRHWRHDADLAGVRDKEGLARLPKEERAAWGKLWAEVDALLAKAATK
jgi:tetratricopeptide (TPR) repeat protein